MTNHSSPVTVDLLVAEIRKIRRQLGGFDYASCEVDLAERLLAGILAPAQCAPEPVVEVRAALANLVAKLNEVHRDPRFKSVWTVNQLHAGQYSGPTYTEELDAAEAALAALSVTSTEREKVTRSSGCVFCDIGLKPDYLGTHYAEGNLILCPLTRPDGGDKND